MEVVNRDKALENLEGTVVVRTGLFLKTFYREGCGMNPNNCGFSTTRRGEFNCVYDTPIDHSSLMDVVDTKGREHKREIVPWVDCGACRPRS